MPKLYIREFWQYIWRVWQLTLDLGDKYPTFWKKCWWPLFHFLFKYKGLKSKVTFMFRTRWDSSHIVLKSQTLTFLSNTNSVTYIQFKGQIRVGECRRTNENGTGGTKSYAALVSLGRSDLQHACQRARYITWKAQLKWTSGPSREPNYTWIYWKRTCGEGSTTISWNPKIRNQMVVFFWGGAGFVVEPGGALGGCWTPEHWVLCVYGVCVCVVRGRCVGGLNTAIFCR